MKFDKISVYNIENAFRGMRNPMDSWDKSDSYTDYDIDMFIIGDKDLKLACKLINAGTEHRKFMRQIFVSVDITAPRYWWSEFDTYKIGVSANSCSTMHTIHKSPFCIDMFDVDTDSDDMRIYFEFIIDALENMRMQYLETNDVNDLRKIKQLLPESFLQKRTVTMNYENVYNIYLQRKNHRLSEWNEHFVNFVESLPLFKEFIKED